LHKHGLVTTRELNIDGLGLDGRDGNYKLKKGIGQICDIIRFGKSPLDELIRSVDVFAGVCSSGGEGPKAGVWKVDYERVKGATL